MCDLKVLLVDDEKDFVEALAERLQLRGINAQTATDGASALRLIDTSPPQVVVLDVMMPGLGGADVLQRIKATHPQIPVILLSGHGSIHEESLQIKENAFDYLVKPIDINELLQKIQEALKVNKNRQVRLGDGP
ncbi:MAG: response regulator [Deltaproteobacteria bacterium]|nr:response regulator [Deltaproteobacteria bacterium]